MTTELSSLDDLPFLGRQDELDKLTQYLRDCIRAQGKTVFIVGEVGIGKTRLANELIGRARALDFQILEGKCLPGSASPFLPFEDALRDHFRIAKADSDDTAERKISKIIKPKTRETRESIRAVELLVKSGSIIAAQENQLGLRAWLSGSRKEKGLGLKEWLKGPRPEAYQEFVVDISRAELARDRFLQTVASLLIELENIKPVLFFIDDLQWADRSSLALLHLLARRARNVRVLLVGTYRSEELAGSNSLEETLQLMSREDLFIKLELKPLEKQSYSEILKKTFQSDFAPTFLDRLYEETEGNPLFALETLRLLIEDRAITRKDTTWVLSLPISRIRIPDKVKDVLARRVAKLDEDDRRILELASVIGDEFESSTIQDILALNKLKLLQSLSSMERIHSLIQSGELGYRFTHSKVREVIYDHLSQGLRKEYHSQVAGWMEKRYSAPERLDEVVTVLANHFFLGDQWEKALTYFAMAGDMAMQIHAHDEAIQSYSHALHTLSLMKRRLPIEIGSSLHERNALAALASGKISEALKALDSLSEAVRAAGDRRWYGKARFLHGWASFWNKDLDTTLQDCGEALTIARRVGDKTLEGRSLYLTGTSLLAKGLRRQAQNYLDDSLRISREAGDKAAESQALIVQLMEGGPSH